MLTPGQIAHFETFGFLMLRKLFSETEMEGLSSQYEDIMRDDREGRPFKGERQSIHPFVEIRAHLIELIDDDRIYRTVEELLGPGFVWVASDGNYYVGDTAWHADGLRHAIDLKQTDWHYPMIKVAFYLDPVTKDTGCLRIIPGSHDSEYAQRLEATEKRTVDPGFVPFGVLPSQVPAFPLETEPGDVVFFNQDLHHGSFGGVGRRMFSMSFVTNPTTAEHVAYLQRAYDATKLALRPHVSLVNSDRPRIRGMVTRLLEIGFDTKGG